MPVTLALLPLLVACSGDEKPKEVPDVKAVVTPPAPPKAVQQPLEGGPFPALFMAQAQFSKGADGKPVPGAAALIIWRKTTDGWKSVRVEDADSNVFHKAMVHGGKLYTIGAEQAFLKTWAFADGKWTNQALWNPRWEGKFNRLRDLEFGDVNGDGIDDAVIATHDSGVIGVGAGAADGTFTFTELHKQADTIVHEVEIGDVDGDGKNEFFATPSARNQSSGKSQPGQVLMFRWDGTTYQESVLDDFEGSHAKEILATDIDGDKKAEFFSVVEAHTEVENGQARIVNPVEIRQYSWAKDGTVSHTVVATIQDKQTRFLVPADYDGDGKIELVAAALKTGLFLLRRQKDGTWTATNFEQNSSGFEHTAYAADLDGDGAVELYVAADDQRELRVYTWSAAANTFERQTIGAIQQDTFTWNLTAGTL
jgi:hypothetical protein